MRILAILVLLVFGVWLGVSRYTSDTIISPLAQDQPPKLRYIFAPKKNPAVLREKVTQTIGNSWKNYSVYVKDFRSNFSMGINEHEIFTAASVNKVPILAALYDQEQKEKVDFDETITIQQKDIQDYGTGSIRYDPPGRSYSIKTLMRLMIQQSDNTAAFILGTHVLGLDATQEIIQSWGLTQTDMNENKTSNADMAKLMEKIYTGGVTNTAHTAEMLGFMQHTDFEEQLPALLPKDAQIYHKIGTGDNGAIHDMGIVVYNNTAYYIGILTTDVMSEEETKKLQAKLSKLIFDYMN